MAPNIAIERKIMIYKNFQYSPDDSIGTYVVKKHDLWFNARNELAVPNQYAAVRIVVNSLPAYWKVKAEKISSTLLEYDEYLDHPKIDYGRFTYIMYSEWMKHLADIKAAEQNDEDLRKITSLIRLVGLEE